MSCWRVLNLSDVSGSQHVPQLLIKPDFKPESYTIFLTDLCNIWSEELDLHEILRRASQQESPIEVSKQDTSQLAILLEHVEKSLTGTDGSLCHITKGEERGIALHTTTGLPGPLGSLQWLFTLQKRTAATLKNELILPLLVSSHIQHERVNSLIMSISEKDRAIAKLMDQYESSGLDLALAFPSMAGSKSGRRPVKREQAARHIPALQPFAEHVWKRETSQLKDGHVSTFGLFQEALSGCTPKIPSQMKSQDGDDSWWSSIPSSFSSSKFASQVKRRTTKTPVKQPSQHIDTEIESEDDFETHENFKLRETPRKQAQANLPSLIDAEDGSSTEDEDDLDAPLKSQIANRTEGRSQPKQPQPQAKSPFRASPTPEATAPAAYKRKGFRIGGAKTSQTVESRKRTSDVDGEDESTPDVSLPTRRRSDTEPTTPRKTFKIGGKMKPAVGSRDGTPTVSPSPKVRKHRDADVQEKDPSAEPVSRHAPYTARLDERMGTPAEEEHEETAEEKAERKRQELKRKNEDLAKKQAHKKKKRF